MKLLNNIQQKIKAPKTQFNAHGKYKYRSCSDILSAVKPLLGTAILHMTDEVIEIGGRNYIKATVTITHDGEKQCATGFAREAEEQKGMNAGQLSCATSSYARKLALSGLFGIDDSHDAGNGSGAKDKPKDLDGFLRGAYEAYTAAHIQSIPEGFECNYEAFVKALKTAAKAGIPVKDRKSFSWTTESIKPFVEAVTLKETLVQINADPSS